MWSIAAISTQSYFHQVVPISPLYTMLQGMIYLSASPLRLKVHFYFSHFTYSAHPGKYPDSSNEMHDLACLIRTAELYIF